MKKAVLLVRKSEEQYLREEIPEIFNNEEIEIDVMIDDYFDHYINLIKLDKKNIENKIKRRLENEVSKI